MKLIPETKKIFLISIPLIIGQLGQMLLGLVDTLMIAKIGVTELAALTLANNLFYVPFVFGIGILTCISVQTSTARGADDAARARSVCRNGTYIGLILGVLFFLITLCVPNVLDYLKQDPVVADHAKPFFLIIMASLIPGMVSIGLKNHADSLNRMWTAFWITIAGVLLNIFLNWVFIYGHLGAPRMELEGAGIATLISRTTIVIGLLLWFAKDSSLKEWTPYHWFKKLDLKECKSLIKLGLPSGLQTLTEVGAFVATGIIIGTFSKEALAAQNIALTCAGIAFMVPLGISIALTIRVGERMGQRSVSNIHQTYLSGWFLTLFFSSLSASIFLLFGESIAKSFISDAPIVISLASSFLVVAGIFQLVDGQQVASVGMLRGLQDTKHPAIICLISYWVIGIPAGCLLAYQQSLGPVGVWWGLAIGLTVASVLLGLRVWKNVSLK